MGHAIFDGRAGVLTKAHARRRDHKGLTPRLLRQHQITPGACQILLGIKAKKFDFPMGWRVPKKRLLCLRPSLRITIGGQKKHFMKIESLNREIEYSQW
jgi:hypothetical protein